MCHLAQDCRAKNTVNFMTQADVINGAVLHPACHVKIRAKKEDRELVPRHIVRLRDMYRSSVEPFFDYAFVSSSASTASAYDREGSSIEPGYLAMSCAACQMHTEESGSPLMRCALCLLPWHSGCSKAAMDRKVVSAGVMKQTSPNPDHCITTKSVPLMLLGNQSSIVSMMETLG